MKQLKTLIRATFMLAASFPALADNNASPEGAAANLVGASQVESIKFDEGQINLTIDEKKELREAIAQTGVKNIDEIKILVWSDHDYPTAGKEASEADVTLAEKRGEAIKSYLKDLNVSDVDVHNMAQKPTEISRFFKTDDYELKSATEATGPNKYKSKVFWKINGGPSRSLVMIIPEKK